ncbi:hypothetical protein [Streptomyces tirandamycinicus]|nr:hypothetical protein [Streptomyces tirandamycinicus]
MTTDLSTLTSAADKWDDMAGEFKKLEDAYERDVHRISLGETWRGFAATAANVRFDATLREYQAAQKEAKALAAVLREAHTQFTDLRGRLRSVVGDAVKAGMKVSEQGHVAYDYDKLDAKALYAARHDPDFESTVRTREGEWHQAIAGAVKAFDDADVGVKIALETVVIDGNPVDGYGFNAEADTKKDIEEYEADHAADIATRINSGENVSAADRAELQRAFRDNGGNKDFSQTFLNSLGADGAVQLGNKLNDGAQSPDKKLKGQYQDLQKGLANTIANATRIAKSVAQLTPGSKAFEAWKKSDDADAEFYREFTAELEKAGTKNYGSNTNPLYGYQSLVSVMSHAGAKFDDQFLYELGDDMIKAENEHKGIFNTIGGGHDGIKSDALDGLLAIMSENPDAATAFFDPDVKGGEGNPERDGDEVKGGADHLHYLAGTGDGAREWPKILMATGTDMDDPFSRTGLGAALQAAATGNVPLPAGQDPLPAYTHTPEQARVMNGILATLDQGPSTEVHENLQVPIAQAIAQYTPDSHEILGGLDGEYAVNMKDGYFVDDKGRAHLATPADALVHVMRGVSDDPDAFGTLNKAENRFINAELDKLPEDSRGYSESNPLSKSGAALGALTAIREDVLNDERSGAYSDADWKSKVAYHVIGGMVTPAAIPTAGGSIVVGDALQRGVDTLAWVWGNDLKADADGKATEAINDRYLDVNRQMQVLVHGWGGERYDLETEDGRDKVQGLTDKILTGHTRGVVTAQGYLSDAPN